MTKTATWRTVGCGVACAVLAMLASAPMGAASTRLTPLQLARVGPGAEPPMSTVAPSGGGVFGFLVTITAPASGATYVQGQPAAAAYACKGLKGVSVTACAGPVANGAEIETSTLGPHTFTVQVQYSDGLRTSRSASYTVIAAGGASPIASPLTAPILGNVSETAKTWRAGGALAHITTNVPRKSKLPLGTTFTFAVNEPASVTFTFTEQTGGRRLGAMCVPQTNKNKRQHSCTRTAVAGTLTFMVHAGTNKVRFEGAISKRKTLRPGSYALKVNAAASGRRSITRALHFTIAKP